MAFNVIGMFDAARDAQAAAQDLRDAGFSGSDISFVGNNARGDYDTVDPGEPRGSHAATGAGTGATGGAVLGGLAGLLVGLGALVIPGIGPVVAAGTLATTLGTAAAGAGIGAATGGLVGGLIGAGVPEEDANVYSEGVRRGGSLLSVQVDDEPEATRAADIMSRHHVVDIDRRGAEYRQAGWSRFDAHAAPYALDVNAPAGATVHTTVTETTPPATAHAVVDAPPVAPPIETRRTPAVPPQVAPGDTIRVPVVEEELRIGKRAVERGGVRVYQRVVETPVQEQVTLRDETVRVERRPVDRPVTEADLAAVREGTVEIREHDEQAVVSKQARIVEEVVVKKEAHERVETVQETVRRTNVDVQEIPGQTRTTGVANMSSTTTGSTVGSSATMSRGANEGRVEGGASRLENAAERLTQTDLNRDGDVGQRDPRNNV
jgi:uncharacterized protein (TIGR02271 family)